MRAPVILFRPTLNLHYKQREWGWERRRDNHTTPSQFSALKWQNRTTCGIQPEAIWITELCCLMAPPNYCGPSGTWIVMVTSWGLLSDTFHWILLQRFPINGKYDYKMVLCPWNTWFLPKYTARAGDKLCTMPAQSRGNRLQSHCKMGEAISGGQSCCLEFLAALMA